MTDCIGCYWFNYTDCKCKNTKRNNGRIDNFCELFLPPQLFKDDCTNCTHSREMYEKTPDGTIIPESMFHICTITNEEYPDYDLPSIRNCGDFKLKTSVRAGRTQYYSEKLNQKLKGKKEGDLGGYSRVLSGLEPRDTCPFYELHRKYGSIKAEETINTFKEEFIESVKKRENQELEEITDLNYLFEIEGAELPSKELPDFNKFFELNDVRVFFHKKKNMIRLVGNFFMNKKLIAVSNALFKGGVIELYTFSRNERLQQSELRLMFKEVEEQ